MSSSVGTYTSANEGNLLEVAKGLAPLIRELAPQGEKERRLPDAVARAFRETGIFRMSRPRERGGLEADPLTTLRVIEELAAADGAAGWCAMICGAGGAFEAYVPADGGAEMYADPGVVIAGVAAPTGRAEAVDGGYRVTGSWTMASACHHCDWLGGAAVVFEGPAPKMLPMGFPEMIVPFFKRSDVQILDTWNAAGLAGTGSHDFAVEGVVVPANRCIRIPMMAPVAQGALFGLPFFGFLSSVVAATALGIARAAEEELGRLAKTKTPFGMMAPLATRATTALVAADARAQIGAARAYLEGAVSRAWEEAKAKRPVSLALHAEMRVAATHAANTAASAVDALYTAGGSTALYAKSPLQRCLRDVHAVTQHYTVAPYTRETQGRVLLGLEPGAPPMF